MADEVPYWIKPGVKVGIIDTVPGVRDPRLSTGTVKTIGKKFIMVEDRHGNVQRFSIANLEHRQPGGYSTVSRLTDLRSARWATEVAANNARVSLTRARLAAEAWGRGRAFRVGVPVPSALDVIRAMLPHADLSDEGLADVLAALPPVEPT